MENEKFEDIQQEMKKSLGELESFQVASSRISKLLEENSGLETFYEMKIKIDDITHLEKVRMQDAVFKFIASSVVVMNSQPSELKRDASREKGSKLQHFSRVNDNIYSLFVIGTDEIWIKFKNLIFKELEEIDLLILYLAMLRILIITLITCFLFYSSFNLSKYKADIMKSFALIQRKDIRFLMENCIMFKFNYLQEISKKKAKDEEEDFEQEIKEKESELKKMNTVFSTSKAEKVSQAEYKQVVGTESNVVVETDEELISHRRKFNDDNKKSKFFKTSSISKKSEKLKRSYSSAKKKGKIDPKAKIIKIKALNNVKEEIDEKSEIENDNDENLEIDDDNVSEESSNLREFDQESIELRVEKMAVNDNSLKRKLIFVSSMLLIILIIFALVSYFLESYFLREDRWGIELENKIGRLDNDVKLVFSIVYEMLSINSSMKDKFGECKFFFFFLIFLNFLHFLNFFSFKIFLIYF